jgi:hypothetical protein
VSQGLNFIYRKLDLDFLCHADILLRARRCPCVLVA